jgi:hypothetical protein
MNCPPAPVKGYMQIYNNITKEWEYIKKISNIIEPVLLPKFKL